MWLGLDQSAEGLKGTEGLAGGHSPTDYPQTSQAASALPVSTAGTLEWKLQHPPWVSGPPGHAAGLGLANLHNSLL